jgi:hypothetical protein
VELIFSSWDCFFVETIIIALDSCFHIPHHGRQSVLHLFLFLERGVTLFGLNYFVTLKPGYPC